MFKIGNRAIGNNFPPYIIAEMSANHNGSIANAKSIIEMAKVSGADAVKLQTYTPDTITINSTSDEFTIHGGLWDGRTLYDLYKEAYMPWDWHKPLFDYAKKVDITIFSSPFDFTAVDLLEDLNAPAYKIASFEAIDLPLIKYAASTKKPLIISTGMATKNEIREAVDAARSAGCEDLVVLHCVSGYPADPKDYNLKTIPDMQSEFDVLVGLSDHTISNTTAIASVAYGVCVIEKHFTLDRSRGGPDDSFSLEPDDLKMLCSEVKVSWEALGSINYERKSGEKDNLKFRRSLYVVKKIKAGETFTSENIRSIRPGFGMLPKHLDEILGKTANCDLEFGKPLKAEYIKGF